MWRRSFLCIFAVGVVGASYMVGCGSESSAFIDPLADGGDGGGSGGDATMGDGAGGGMILNDGGVCRGAGVTCATGSECCSSACDPTAKKCVAGVGAANCKLAAAACASSTECCNTCVNGACGAAACIGDNQACSSGASCCGGVCTNGTCAPLNTTCKTSGNTCAQSAECCSKLCQGGRCQIASSYCVQSGDVCSAGSDCCGGVCTKASGATLGTCGAPPATGGTNCAGGYDGVVCNGCTDCCSRLCAPFLSGVKICQPANGCHIEGDLCGKDTDCCGGDNTNGLPGNGNVHCAISPGYTIGICLTPGPGTDAGNGACNPEGDVCHYKNYVCGPSSSARNDCCLHLGSSSDCTLDAVGVPRCHAIGAPGGPACRTSGQTCAFSGDCCNNVPCVPGPTGQLVCYAGTSGGDGGAVCVPATGPCTVNADCCTGAFCSVPPGSIKGTCNALPLGSGGGGGDGGSSAPDGGSPTSTCSLYGQSCATSASCCSSVPCTGTDGFTPCFAGQAACTCVYPTPR